MTEESVRAHAEYRKALREGFYCHGYVPRHGCTLRKKFEEVCLVDALRKLGTKVRYKMAFLGEARWERLFVGFR